MRYINILFIFPILFILVGCGVTKTICPCEAPEIIRLDKKVIEINAQISLNEPSELGGMNVKIWLTTSDHTPLPTNIEADYYYLRSSNLARGAFEGKFTTKRSDVTIGMMELEAINAPRWGIGELVDVAVHLTDSRGKIHFVKKDAVEVLPADR
jgi:hypothetical protein